MQSNVTVCDIETFLDDNAGHRQILIHHAISVQQIKFTHQLVSYLAELCLCKLLPNIRQVIQVILSLVHVGADEVEGLMGVESVQ